MIVPGAIAIVAMIGLIGLAIDAGSLYYNHRKLQVIADFTAIAGAQQSISCAGVSTCGTMKSAVTGALAANGITNSTLLTHCAAPAASGVTVTLNNPPCSLGTADPNRAKTGYVETVVSQAIPTIFIRLLGTSAVTMSARAEASHAGGGNCIYALDATGAGAITVDPFAALSSDCGVIDESNSPAGVACPAFGTINVTHFNVVGQVLNILCTISPAIITNASVPSPADPLAYLPAPASQPCGVSTVSPFRGSSLPVIANAVMNAHAVFYPDAAYCGGIFIGTGANVTFMPGTYMLQPTCASCGGGLQIDLGANVTGPGVTFYNGGSTANAPVVFLMSSLLPGSSITLTAPSSGSYAGVLFFQPSTNTSPAIILGSSTLNTNVEGAYYFPNAKVQFALSGAASYNILVAKDIRFGVLSTAASSFSTSAFASNFSGLLSGTPLNNGAATLVQ